MKATISLVLAAAATYSLAHSIFQEVYVNGVDQGHKVGVRTTSYNNPITDVTLDDIVCNGIANPLDTPVTQTIIAIPAGASVTTEWHHSILGVYPSDPDDPIASSHKGPIMTYLAKVDSALQNATTDLKWFKIWEDGYDNATQTWAVDTMIANDGKVTFTMPSCVPSGQYLMRHELIALHGASVQNGAQFYLECAQIEVTGGGTPKSAPTVSFPGAYSATDPGILLNIYWPTVTNYTIPGPSVITC